jgi:hypothetical protein
VRPDADALEAARIADLRYTDTVDIVGIGPFATPFAVPSHGEPVLDALLAPVDDAPPPELTLRFMPTLSGRFMSTELLEDDYLGMVVGSPQIRCVVIFMPLPYLFFDNWFWYPRVDCESRDLEPRRVVYNISVHERDRYTDRHPEIHCPYRGLEEVVWIFHRGTEDAWYPDELDDSAADYANTGMSRYHPSGMMWNLTGIMAATLFAGVATTVVGLRDLDYFHSWLLDCHNEDGEYSDDGESGPHGIIEANFLLRCSTAYRGDLDEDGLIAVLDSIRFLSLDEYRNMMGDRAGIETSASGVLGEDWRPWMTLPPGRAPKGRPASEDSEGMDAADASSTSSDPSDSSEVHPTEPGTPGSMTRRP